MMPGTLPSAASPPTRTSRCRWRRVTQTTSAVTRATKTSRQVGSQAVYLFVEMFVFKLIRMFHFSKKTRYNSKFVVVCNRLIILSRLCNGIK